MIKFLEHYGSWESVAPMRNFLGAVEYLITHGAKIDPKFDGCYYGFTALRCATKIGNLDAIRLLLKAGANPALGSYSALHDAAFYGHYEAVKLLLPRFYFDYIKPATWELGSLLWTQRYMWTHT
jgi:hypothetical protein